ncbi:hypothetical protein [Fontivita pretiosa]|uniref:hypothetical protein n=1 Tax=Fontivita pretiosa TaxID=2989684 RepID=UPI003D16D8FE
MPSTPLATTGIVPMGHAMCQELFKRLLAALIGVELAVFVVSLRASLFEPLGHLLPDPDLAADAALIVYDAYDSPATAAAADEDETDPPHETHEAARKLRRCHLSDIVGEQDQRSDQTRPEQSTGGDCGQCAQCSPRP